LNSLAAAGWTIAGVVAFARRRDGATYSARRAADDSARQRIVSKDRAAYRAGAGADSATGQRAFAAGLSATGESDDHERRERRMFQYNCFHHCLQKWDR
jgi:hypothetical protein